MIFKQRDGIESEYFERNLPYAYRDRYMSQTTRGDGTRSSYSNLRPLSDPSDLTSRIFDIQHPEETDPLHFPEERAHVQKNQINFLVRQLGARHAINYRIRKNHAYQESFLGTQLLRAREAPYFSDLGSKRQSNLEKELVGLDRDRWAEEVSCWRDTNRILNDVFDHWNEYSDQRRKSRVLNIDD